MRGGEGNQLQMWSGQLPGYPVTLTRAYQSGAWTPWSIIYEDGQTPCNLSRAARRTRTPAA